MLPEISRTLLELPPRGVEAGLGVFFIAMVPARHWLSKHHRKITLWHLAVIGLGLLPMPQSILPCWRRYS
jgi:hypothetical protein